MELSVFNVLTLILMALTIWLGVSRFTAGLDSNWAMVYYVLLVAHLKAFDGGLNPYWVYVGVVAGLLLRFEFMGGAVLKVVWGMELAAMTYYVWRFVSLIMMW